MKISYQQYFSDIDTLAKKIQGSGKAYTEVYGVPRGGTSAAAYLHDKLRLRLILDPRDIQPCTLIVDDLIDSGKTRQKFAGNDFAAVYAKPSHAAEATFVGCEVGGEWIIFPEEAGNGIEENFRRTLEYIGEDTTREGLIETPARMRRAYDEIFAGYKTDPRSLLKTFTQGACEEMVILKHCEFYSTCEHHFFPFFGHVSIGYLPSDRVIGISKLARLVDCFSRRMQIQERMTTQIADIIESELNARGVYVVCEGVHFCMTSRGVRKRDASMVTSAIRGIFRDNPQARAEFLELVKK